MAVYTEVTEAALAAFLAGYAIGEPLSLRGIAEGVENSNFLLDTTHGRRREALRVPAEMVVHEAADEVVGVVVALLHPQGQRDAGLAAGLPQQVQLELAFQEGVGRALVHQDLRQAGAVLDQGRGVVAAPGGTVGAEIGGERLLPPGAAQGRDDRGEGGDRPEARGVPQRQGQRAMAAHGMAGDRLPPHIRRELRRNDPGQLARDPAFHAEMRRPGRLGGVEVEARALAQVIGRVVGHALATRRGIGHHEDQPELGGEALGAGLLGEVGLGAGEAGQEPEEGELRPRLAGSRRQVEAEAHRRAGHRAVVAAHKLRAAEAPRAGKDLHQ